MKKILILGTSLASVEIVQTAKEMGSYTIVTDNLPPELSLAKYEADEYWMISTADIDQLERKCREENISAVFAGVSEFNLDRVKELTDRLGLPCYIEEAAWKYARDKGAFKKKCREVGIPVAEEYAVSDPPIKQELRGIEYPVVVKPVDGSGNKGLSICYNDDELIVGCEKARNSSAGRNILIERYITGTESWHYYYLAGGEIRHVCCGRAYRQPGYPTYLYLLGTSSVQDLQEYKKELDDKCIALLRNIGCKRGIAWFQFIRDEKGRYYALEMAERMSADNSGKSIKKAIGVNQIAWMLDIALGNDHTADMLPKASEPPYNSVHCVYYHFAGREGRVSDIQGYEELDQEKYQVSVLTHKGDSINKYQMMVRIVFNAKNGREICDNVKYINSRTGILDENNQNMYIQFMDFDEVMESNRGLFVSE